MNFLKSLSWTVCSISLRCGQPHPSAAHPLPVIEALLRSAAQGDNELPPFYWLPEDSLPRMQEGAVFPVRLVFPGQAASAAGRLVCRIRALLERPRAHLSLVSAPPPREESLDALMDSTPLPESREICLDFISPLRLPAPEKNSFGIGAEALCGLFLERIIRLSHAIPEVYAKKLAAPWRTAATLPWHWEHREYTPASKTADGVRQISGMEGPLVIRGDIAGMLPIMLICSRIGAGTQSRFGQGAFVIRDAAILKRFLLSRDSALASCRSLAEQGYAVTRSDIPGFFKDVSRNSLSGGASVLLAQEGLLRFLRLPVSRAFPLDRQKRGAPVIPYAAIGADDRPAAQELEALRVVLPEADRPLLPLIRTALEAGGLPQMNSLRSRLRASLAVAEGRSLGLGVCLTEKGMALDEEKDREALLDILARHALPDTFTEAPPDTPDEEEGDLKQPWRRSCHILHPGAAIGLDGEAVIARHEGETLQRIPFGQVSSLILHGSGSITTPLVRQCLAHGIPIVYCSAAGRIIGTAQPQTPSWRMRVREHVRAWDRLGEEGRLKAAKSIVAAKIRGCLCRLPRTFRGNVKRYLHDGRKALASVGEASSAGSLLGAEGAFARISFGAFNSCLLVPAFRSERRLPGKKPDIWNAALDMASALCFNRISAELIAEGLDPCLGFLHRQHLRYMTLAADIQELFRADTERWLIRLVNQNMLRAEHFEEKDGRWEPTEEGLRLFIAEWEKGMQTCYSWQPDSPDRSIARQVRSLRLWLCAGLDPELYCGDGWTALTPRGE